MSTLLATRGHEDPAVQVEPSQSQSSTSWFVFKRSRTYEEEVDSSIQTLTSIIEPLMMIAVGIVVGIIIISMYLPMFKMLSLVK